MKRLILAAVAATALSTAAQAAVTVTYEAPGAQSTTKPYAVTGVETFDGRGSGSFTTDFGTGGKVNGTYSNVSIYHADQYGGAGGTDDYAMTWGQHQLDLDRGINDFGFWWSAVDAGNVLELFSGSTKLFTLSAGDVLAAIASDWRYKGNPTAPFKDQDYGEKFVFVNINSTTAFDRLTFNAAGGGFETDNHTVGLSGAIPEPGTWVMMILGFGGMGAVLRHRRRVVA